VSLAFYIGLRVGAVTTRKSNWIDIEYLRYLPFCNVFSTGDKLQVDLANVLMRKNQDLIEADPLKKDMSRLNDWWNSLSDEERFEESAEYGSQPPDLHDCSTVDVWRKRFGPRVKGRGNLALKMSPEKRKALFEHLRPQIEAAEAAIARSKNTAKRSF
jgi:hypothetical protein